LMPGCTKVTLGKQVSVGILVQLDFGTLPELYRQNEIGQWPFVRHISFDVA